MHENNEIDVSSVTFTPWDIVDDLVDEVEIRALIEAALEEADPAAIAAVMRDVARARSINRLAQATGLDRTLVCRFFAKDETTALIPTAEQAAILARAVMQATA